MLVYKKVSVEKKKREKKKYLKQNLWSKIAYYVLLLLNLFHILDILNRCIDN